MDVSHNLTIYVMIYNCTKFECGKWQGTVTTTTYAEAVPVPMWSTDNGCLPLLEVPFFKVVYVDTDEQIDLCHGAKAINI